MKRAAIIAKGGLITGLGVLFLYLASILTTGRITLLVCTGCLMIIALIEIGTRGAFAVYLAVSLLGFLLLPQKWMGLMFLLFFGLYPLVKKRIECIKHKGLSIGLKFFCFNIDVVLIYFILTSLLGFTISFSGWLAAGILIANVIFYLFDYLLGILFDQYLRRICRYRG